MKLERHLRRAVDATVGVRAAVPRSRSALVTVSGIDGCGKSVLSSRIGTMLEREGVRVAPLSVDDWLNLPAVRFGRENAAEHFYRHAIRFEEMFARLVDPLCALRSISIEVDAALERASEFHRKRFEFSNVDVVLLEGIYLLKRELRARFDFSVWIECSFNTALERAVSRAQEGLSPDETVARYHTIYSPAQEIHFERDDPMRAAGMVIGNERNR